MKKSGFVNKILHRIMRESRYALFEVCSQQFPRKSAVVVEAHAADEAQSMWCSCEDLVLPSNLPAEWPVILKFINRKRGNFIQIQGSASTNGKNIFIPACADRISNPVNPIIHIRVHQVAWFDKKSGEVEFFA